ncbi:hypothetical protein [Streptomyces sp. NPDC002690]
MVPSVRTFFEEVRTAFAGVAESLDLAGPDETEHVLPVSTYTGGGVAYEISLDRGEGAVGCGVGIEKAGVTFIAGIEQISIAAGLLERRGSVSYSARNLGQLRKSLLGQIGCVPRLHPLLSGGGDAAVVLMRRAHAREWWTRGQSGAR